MSNMEHVDLGLALIVGFAFFFIVFWSAAPDKGGTAPIVMTRTTRVFIGLICLVVLAYVAYSLMQRM
jgi:hypothetical protein